MAAEPEFFIDRSLGRHLVPDALRACGLTVITMADFYGERAGQELKDETWLREAGRHGWIVLMKDDAIRRRPAERDALIEGGVRRVLPYQRAPPRRRTGRTLRGKPPSDPPSESSAWPLHLRRLRASDSSALAAGISVVATYQAATAAAARPTAPTPTDLSGSADTFGGRMMRLTQAIGSARGA
jgi:hypothetical protein